MIFCPIIDSSSFFPYPMLVLLGATKGIAVLDNFNSKIRAINKRGEYASFSIKFVFCRS